MPNVVKVRNPRTQRFVLYIMGLGMLTMSLTLAYTSFTQPSFIRHNAVQTPAAPTGASGNGAVAETIDVTTINLTARLEKDPNDVEALTAFAEHLLHNDDWLRAEPFINRAIIADPTQVKAYSVSAIIQHKKGLHKEAVKILEQGLALEDTASLRYNIGVLYAFFIHDTAKAKAMLTAALQAPKNSPALTQAINEALQEINKQN